MERSDRRIILVSAATGSFTTRLTGSRLRSLQKPRSFGSLLRLVTVHGNPCRNCARKQLDVADLPGAHVLDSYHCGLSLDRNAYEQANLLLRIWYHRTF